MEYFPEGANEDDESVVGSLRVSSYMTATTPTH